MKNLRRLSAAVVRHLCSDCQLSLAKFEQGRARQANILMPRLAPLRCYPTTWRLPRK